MKDVMEAIRHRRAIRRFDSRQIEEETLQQILEAGLYAPAQGESRASFSLSARTGK